MEKQTKIILLLGFLIAGSISYSIWDAQRVAWYDGFRKTVHRMNLSVLSKLELNEKILESLISFYRASNFVSREEFDIFTESLIRDQKYIHALEWVPGVPHSRRQEFEQRARLEGLKDFQFMERSKTGKMVRAETREIYYPVYYIYPMLGNQAALGFDLASNSIRRETLVNSLESGKATASSRINLVQENKSSPGFLIFYPHYRGNIIPETLAERRESFIGFALGVYLIEKMMENIIKGSRAAGLNLVIYENSEIDQNNLLYGKLIEDKVMELIYPVIVLGRTWTLFWQTDKKFNGGISQKFPLIAGGGIFSVLFLLAIIFEKNLTRSREIEEEVKLRTAELKRANNDLEQFAFIASHDLKAPLRGIAHLSEWIKEDLGEHISDVVRSNLDRLVMRVKNMDTLIQGILEYSKAGKGTGKTKKVIVEDMIKEVLELLEVTENSGVVVEPGMPVLNTDPIKLSQIFSNLINNAIKHNSSENKKLVVSSKPNGNFYEFTISDNGPGIDPKYHDKIFQIFQTLEPTADSGNTGIGLPIVKKLVEEAGGSIRVESSLGNGASFIFLWPK